MEWPQITLIALMAAEFGIVVVKHGEPRDNFNLWISGLGASIVIWLLYKGGFWS